ncbi:MAG: hypothetical protein WC796_02085 [Candidatus Pacearchaeota archaeon]
MFSRKPTTDAPTEEPKVPIKCTITGAFSSGRTEIPAAYHGTVDGPGGEKYHAFTYLRHNKDGTIYAVERACIPVKKVGTLDGAFTIPAPETGISRSYKKGTPEYAESLALMKRLYQPQQPQKP